MKDYKVYPHSHLIKINKENWCFLVAKHLMWAEMMKEVLEDAQIQHLCLNEKGQDLVLKLDGNDEMFYFYVPIFQYKEAKALVLEMFPQEIMI